MVAFIHFVYQRYVVISKDTLDAETREKLYGVIVTMIFAAILVGVGPGLIKFLVGVDSDADIYSGFTVFFDRFSDNLRYIVIAILSLFMMVSIAKLRMSKKRDRSLTETDSNEDQNSRTQ